MDKAYRQAVDRLYELQKFGIKLGLNSTANLLERLDNPHLRVPCVHLAGTNGKGSVAAMLEAACLAHNAASIRLLENVGFRREGIARGLVCINGRWQDHIVFALLADDPTN